MIIHYVTDGVRQSITFLDISRDEFSGVYEVCIPLFCVKFTFIQCINSLANGLKILYILDQPRRGYEVEYQSSYQAGYQPLGGPTDSALRLIPGLIRGLILD